MKANTPEKIYLADFTNTTEPVFYINQDKLRETDVEYTRTDAFIDKACEWLKEIFSEYESLTDYNPTNDFKKYMKGE